MEVTPQIAIVLSVLAAALILFWTERVAVEIVGMCAVLVLIMTGVVGVQSGFSGFGNPALVMIASVLTMSASLVRNGAGERIADRIQRLTGGGEERVALALFAAVLGISAFINNVAATAMFLPVAENLARRYRIRPSRLLMPVAYASLLGGVCTLTGTSTNVAVSGALSEAGMPQLGLFEISWIGIPLAAAGLIYLVLFSRYLPGRAGGDGAPETGKDRRLFVTELEVPDGSPAIGRTLRELDLKRQHRLSAFGLIRGSVRLVEDVIDTPLRADDVVVVEGDVRAINRAVAASGLRRKRSTKVTPVGQGAPALVEATISYSSPLIGRTLREIDMRGRYGLDVIALWRRGGPIVEKVGHVRLRLGDDLLIQGALPRIRQLAGDPLYLLLNDRVLPRYEPRKELLSVLAFALALACAGWQPEQASAAFLLGALFVVVTGCITLEESYRALNLQLLLLIGSMIGVAHAIQESDTAEWISTTMLAFIGSELASPIVVLALLYWLTVLLTQSMSNAAAALLVLPIGFEAANTVPGLVERTVAITIAVAASLAFMTPLEPACLLVMSTGRYRFVDFARFGAPLSMICFLIVMALVHFLYT